MSGPASPGQAATAAAATARSCSQDWTRWWSGCWRCSAEHVAFARVGSARCSAASPCKTAPSPHWPETASWSWGTTEACLVDLGQQEGFDGFTSTELFAPYTSWTFAAAQTSLGSAS